MTYCGDVVLGAAARLRPMNDEHAASPPPGWAAHHPRILGALLLLAMHALLAPFGAGVLGIKPEAGLYLIGIAQLAYAVPVWILLLKLGRSEMAKGVLFAALATFVINAAGCAAFIWSLSKIDG